MPPGRTTDATLLRTLLDAMPAFVFVVDQDVRILDYNKAAGELLGLSRQEILRRRAGNLLPCMHAAGHPGGCGGGDVCRSCVVRKAVTEASTGNRSVRKRARMELLSGGELTEVYALITASPFAYKGKPMVILVIEDFREIIELQRIVPICMHCKKVRTDDQYWTQVDAYFSRHWDLRFSHGYCPDCHKLELEKLNARFSHAAKRSPRS